MLKPAVLTVALAALTALSTGQASAAQIHGWRVVAQTSEVTAVAGEGVATVRVPGRPALTYFTDGASRRWARSR